MRRYIVVADFEEAVADTTPPSVPTGLTASNITQTGFTGTWNASTGEPTGYEISINDGTAINTGTSLTYTKSDAVASTAYTMKVRAYDAAGNRSAYSSNINITTLAADTTPPSKPEPAITNNGGPTFLTWAASTDNVGIAGYDVYCRSQITDPYFKWNTNIITDLTYTFEPNYPTGAYYTYLRAIDTSGNYTDSNVTYFNIAVTS